MAGPTKKAGIATSKRPGGGAKSVASKPGGPSFRPAKATPPPKVRVAVKAAASPASRQMASKAKTQASTKALGSKVSIPKGETMRPIGSPAIAKSVRVQSTAPRLATPPRRGYSIPKQR